MPLRSLKLSFILKSLLAIALLSLGIFFVLKFSFSKDTFDLSSLGPLGQAVQDDFASIPALALTKNDDGYEVKDDTKSGIDIQFASDTEEQKKAKEENKQEFKINFPNDYLEPIEIKLDEERAVTITDQTKEKFKSSLLASKVELTQDQEKTQKQAKNEENDYLLYKNDRKSIYYAYQKDSALNERKLKNWIIYEKPSSQEETESYQIDNAKIKKNDQGQIEVFYFGDKEMQNEKTMAEVDQSLLDRAQRTIEKDMGEDLLNNETPDFIIPEPYYLNKDGQRTNLDWNIDQEKNTISLSFTPKKEDYPIALDPTLQFTVASTISGGDVITGEASSLFGRVLISGDFNGDGKNDLAVGAYQYSSSAGRVYIFYNDGGSMTASAVSADVIITGEASSSYFGQSLSSGDFNSDGRIDLAVAAHRYSSNTGRAYIFYNDGSYPTTASGADVIIDGENSGDYFGDSMVSGDFNADGRIDLVVGSDRYMSVTGRAYIFYNDGSMPTTAASADVIITGEATNNYFSLSMASGDFNADGKIDLAIGAYGYSTQAGRAYIFYNDGSIPTTAAGADVIIDGEAGSIFGESMASGDFNADGKTDLAVGGSFYSTNTGRAYIFYNDGSIPTTAASADIIITGESTNNRFGNSMISGDLNADGKTDLVVGAYVINSANGKAYIFYNDGSIPTAAGNADVMISGESSGWFSNNSMATGDFNADGKIDLAVGAYQYSSGAGRAYIFYSQNGQVNTNFSITGEAASNFGYSMTSGDFNADGKTDLAVGANKYSSYTGRVYIFYNDGSVSTAAAEADVVITGQGADSYFGCSMTSGDFNADGRTDLAVGAYYYTSYTGRAYVFYNDGSIPTAAASADVVIAGISGSYFGCSMTSGDFNADGRIDLAIGGLGYSSSAGRAWIFYNDGSIPTSASGADVAITGEASSYFGVSMISGDLNADGRTDLIVGARYYSSRTGRAYIFYNDGSLPTTAATADVKITGPGSNTDFSFAMTSGDFNADGRTDLAIGAYAASTAYIFYNDGSIPTTSGTADVIITGEASSIFGYSMTSGDFNADGKTDLAIGAYGYSSYAGSYAGSAYIFYNDGSIPTTAATADIIIIGETASGWFGYSMTSGDFNADGRTDLAVGAYNVSSSGRAYIYEARDNYAWQVQDQPDRMNIDPKVGEVMVIEGEKSSGLAYSMVSGDFNADGKTDLAVGAYYYSSSAGRVYIFYNDGSIPNAAAMADVTIAGEAASNYFCYSMTAGDFNADGKTDLAVGAPNYSTNIGRVYIFYNDGSYPITAVSADVIITGEASSYFGRSMTSGDLNVDGRADLIVGTYNYSSNTGRAYIFYNDGSIPTTAATADVIITGESIGTYFGVSMTSGDFNADGKTDLAVGGHSYSSSTGRVYIFYGDGVIPTAAASADVIITGETTSNNFGSSMTSGDFNADGRIDLAVGANGYSAGVGRVYIFYNDGSIPTTAATADVIITGEASVTNSYFCASMTSGDFNADGRTDLAVGASGYDNSIGRAYVFYNDGSIPTTAATADVTITGEMTNNYFGKTMISGDFNFDGKTDLAVGAYYYSSGFGRTYIYTFNDSQGAGGATSDYFGCSMTSGDFNADGKTDLAVGAYGYSSNTGRTYIFYNNGSISPVSSSADVTITGEASSYFGYSMTSGDFNADGKTDLAVGAYYYSSSIGRAYIFYGDGSIPTTAASADVKIGGEGISDRFGWSMTSGDFNADGRMDLAVGAYVNSAYAGRAYIFYNDGSIPTSATTADVKITGESSSRLGYSMTSGDFNADGKTDLAVGAYYYSSSIGRAYIFYGDGSIPTTAATADQIITGSSGDYFGTAMTSGDFNADGKIDLAVGAFGSASGAGRTFILYNDGSIPTTAAAADVIITGENSNDAFGTSMVSGDFNADGRTDLAVGANIYPSLIGRAYVFYNDNYFPSAAANADEIMTGEATNNYFGISMASGDFNVDGKTDLALGAQSYSSSTGKVYIIITEAKASEQINKVNYRGAVQFKGGAVKMK